MGRIGGISKNKSRVIEYAKKNGRQTIWLDDSGQWRASLNILNTPYNCQKWQVVDREAHDTLLKQYSQTPIPFGDLFKKLLLKEVK